MKSFVAIGSLVAALTACGTGDSDSASFPHESINLMAPAAPGGGWDTTARVVAKALEETEIAPVPVTVFNVDGGSGTIGLAQMLNEYQEDDHTITITGLTMMGAIHTLNSPVTLADVTPIARLITEYEAIVVPSDSPYQNIDDLVADWKSKKASLSWAGGGQGGPDHQLVGMLGNELGLSPQEINYVIFEGGGATLPQLLGGRINAASIGLSEALGQIESGQLRPLAVSSEERLDVLPDVPTLIESGYDVVMPNWRGIVAPPGISETAQQWYIGAITRMTNTPEWEAVVKENGWTPYVLTGAEFGNFLRDNSAQTEKALRGIGLI